MVRVFHKVKDCTNAVKCLANAFDNCANVGFGRLTEQFWRRGGDYHEVEYFTKAYTEEVADALYSKTRNFNQTKQYPRLLIIFTHAHSTLRNIYKRGS